MKMSQDDLDNNASTDYLHQDDIDPKIIESSDDFYKLIEAIRSLYLDELEFSRCKNNKDKVKYCLTKDEVNKAFNFFIEKNSKKKDDGDDSGLWAKNSDKARSHRLDGNKLFESKKYSEALWCYNQALLLAPFKSSETAINNQINGSCEELPLILANISATLFRLEKFKECIETIDEAIEHGYPINQRHTLLLRRSMCLKACQKTEEARSTFQEALDSLEMMMKESLNIGENARNEPKDDELETSSRGIDGLKSSMESTFASFKADNYLQMDLNENYCNILNQPYPRNSKLPAAVDSVVLKSSPERGRHLRAIKSIPPSKVVLSEKPYAVILNPQFADKFCHHCCRKIRLQLHPCPSCSYARYCSSQCSKEALDTYHRNECAWSKILNSTGSTRLALRMLLVTGVERAAKIAQESRSYKNAKNEKKDDHDKRNDEYRSILSLIDHHDKLSFTVASRQTVAACFYSSLLKNQMNLINDERSEDDLYILIASLILTHIQQISVNSVVIFHQPLIPGPFGYVGIDVKNQTIATALYPTLSLVNHSCIPNTESFFVGSKVYLMSRNVVNRGEEITFTYGPLYRKVSRIERLETLKSQYYFDCDCKACAIPDSTRSTSPSMSPSLPSAAANADFDGLLLADAFLCPKCNGPFLLSKFDHGTCLKCKADTIPMEKVEIQLANGKKLSDVGKAFIHLGRLTEGEKLLEKALTCFTRVCYPENRLLLNILSDLYHVHIQLESFDAARRYSEESARIKRIIFDEKSTDHLSCRLQLTTLKWNQLKKMNSNNRSTSINKKLMQKLLKETEEVISLAKDILKTHEIGERFIILDSSLVTCLKELMELEKLKNTAVK